MKKQFIPFKQALQLKKLGFDEECLAGYNDASNLFGCQAYSIETDGGYWNGEGEINPLVTAPLWQQAFDWFRTEHKLRNYIDSSPESEIKMRYFYVIKFDNGYSEREPFFSGWFESYPEAQEKCLNKLISFLSK